MRSPFFFALLCLLALHSLFAQESQDQQPVYAFSQKEMTQGYRERTLIVRHAAQHEPDEVERLERVRGLQTSRRFERLNGLRVLRLPEGESLETTKKQLEASGLYSVVAKDDIRTAYAVPNDPNFSVQWALRNTGTGGAKAGADMSATTAWDLRSDASSVIVAVVDSGLRLDHPDIVGNLWVNAGETPGDGVDNDRNGYIDDVHGIDATAEGGTAAGNPNDENGHGTHVAGIIGATGNNGVGIAGVAWKVKLMPLKFLSSSGKGSTQDAIACINYAVAKKASIINASYGNEIGKASYNSAEAAAIQSARNAGVIFVAAAGNDTQNLDLDKSYPASYTLDNIVTVGSTSNLDDPSTFSNYGLGSCDLFAPGEQILSLNHADTSSAAGYVYKSGTSMAAPQTSGALALLKAQYPADSYRALINRLLRTVDPLASLSTYCQTRGRLNLAKALASTDSRPFNDDFSTRAQLSGSNLFVRSSNTLATIEVGEPAHAGLPAKSTLWWEWSSASSVKVTFDTAGSEVDTVLAIYSGTTLQELQTVASNDDSSGTSSRVSFTSAAGTRYKVAVGSKSAQTGTILLNIGGVPEHDLRATPRQLQGLSLAITDINSSASAENNDPSIEGYLGGRSLWYKWTAPVSRKYQLAVTSGSFSAVAGVYTAAAGGALNLEASGFANDLGNLVCDFTTVEGTEYLFCVNTTHASSTGQFVLNLTDSLAQIRTSGPITNAAAVNAEGYAFVADGEGEIYCVDPNGYQFWKRSLGTGQDSSSVAIDASSRLITPSVSGILYSITGPTSLIWQRDTGSSIHNNPTIGADGSVYIKDDAGILWAFRGDNGQVRWTYDTNSTDTYSGASLSADGTLHVGDGDGVLHAVSAASGAKVWTFTSDGAIYTSPAIDRDGNLYFATTTGSVYSLSKAGTQRWRINFGSSITSSPVLGTDGTVYFGGYDSKLHALRASDGTERWNFPMGGQVRAASPAIGADGTIYMPSYDKLLYAVNPDGTLKRVYALGAIVRSSPVIAGNKLYVGCNDNKLYIFDIGQGAAASDWPMKSFNAQRTARQELGELRLTTDLDASLPALIGGRYTLSVAASGSSLVYTWYKDGNVLAGAVSGSLTLDPVKASDAGTYRVQITSPGGTVSSSSVQLRVLNPEPGRLTNMSVRALSEGVSEPLIVGFSVADGTEPKPILLRGLGASLINVFKLADAIPDPEMRLYDNSQVIRASNLDWGGGADLLQAFKGFTGFPELEAKDPALLLNLSGGYTAWVFDSSGKKGVSMAELYDADPRTGAKPPSGRLVNISAKAMVRDGNQVIVAGFVISGNVPMKLLIRGVGQTLAGFGVPGVLGRPRLDLYRSQTLVQSNELWGGEAAISTAASKVGAFPLANASSHDAALLVTLPPDSYSVQLVSADGTPGVALVEVYVVPE